MDMRLSVARGMVRIRDLDPGSLFIYQDKIVVKTNQSHNQCAACECIVIGTGEHLYDFMRSEKSFNDQWVQPALLTPTISEGVWSMSERKEKFSVMRQITLEVQRQQEEIYRQRQTRGNTLYISGHLLYRVTSEAKSHFRNNRNRDGSQSFMGLKVIQVQEENHITVAQVDPFSFVEE